MPSRKFLPVCPPTQKDKAFVTALFLSAGILLSIRLANLLKKKNSDIFITFIANEVEAFNVIS